MRTAATAATAISNPAVPFKEKPRLGASSVMRLNALILALRSCRNKKGWRLTPPAGTHRDQVLRSVTFRPAFLARWPLVASGSSFRSRSRLPGRLPDIVIVVHARRLVAGRSLGPRRGLSRHRGLWP